VHPCAVVVIVVCRDLCATPACGDQRALDRTEACLGHHHVQIGAHPPARERQISQEVGGPLQHDDRAVHLLERLPNAVEFETDVGSIPLNQQPFDGETPLHRLGQSFENATFFAQHGEAAHQPASPGAGQQIAPRHPVQADHSSWIKQGANEWIIETSGAAQPFRRRVFRKPSE
jgi:hypothetical protein